MTMQQHLPKWLAVAGLALAANMSALAQTKEVTFAHQDMLVPLRTIMESGELEKATGYKINWRMFGGGGDVIRAMASGDVQMGEAGSFRVFGCKDRIIILEYGNISAAICGGDTARGEIT